MFDGKFREVYEIFPFSFRAYEMFDGNFREVYEIFPFSFLLVSKKREWKVFFSSRLAKLEDSLLVRPPLGKESRGVRCTSFILGSSIFGQTQHENNEKFLWFFSYVSLYCESQRTFRWKIIANYLSQDSLN